MKYTRTFDEAYYARFYGATRPRQEDRDEVNLLGDYICGHLRYLGQEVQPVLDIGCGLGFWREVISRSPCTPTLRRAPASRCMRAWRRTAPNARSSSGDTPVATGLKPRRGGA